MVKGRRLSPPHLVDIELVYSIFDDAAIVFHDVHVRECKRLLCFLPSCSGGEKYRVMVSLLHDWKSLSGEKFALIHAQYIQKFRLEKICLFSLLL